MTQVRFPADSVMVRDKEITLTFGDTHFLYTEDMVINHLMEGWADDESTFCEVDGKTLELFPHHYRWMLQQMNPFSDRGQILTLGRR